MISPRNQMIEWIEQGAIPAERMDEALRLSTVAPDGAAWHTFLNKLLLCLGCLALAASAMFFIAYNWNDIGRFAKFGLVEACMALAIYGYWKLGTQTLAAKMSLLVAALLSGVLLALYGQTYQTGADTWQLFFYWALLILPWVAIGRFAALCLFWIALVNLSLILYFRESRHFFWLLFSANNGLAWTGFILNTFALLVWEYLATHYEWLNKRWATRLLAVACGIAITFLATYSVLDFKQSTILALPVWAIWLAALYFFYQTIQRDLFMLAGGCLSVIVVFTAFLGRVMLHHSDVGGFLILALIVTGMGSGSAFWLKNIHREWQS